MQYNVQKYKVKAHKITIQNNLGLQPYNHAITKYMNVHTLPNVLVSSQDPYTLVNL